MNFSKKKQEACKYLETVYSKYTRTDLKNMLMEKFNISRLTARDYLVYFEYNHNYGIHKEIKHNIVNDIRLSIGQKCKISEHSMCKDEDKFGRIVFINNNMLGIRIKKYDDSYLETFNVPDLMNDSRKLSLWYEGKWVHFSLKGVMLNNKFSFLKLVEKVS